MVIVDTNIFISAIRGNEIAKQLIKKYMPNIGISVVTEMELYAGANSNTKREIVDQIVLFHEVIYLNKATCIIALNLIKTYNSGNSSLYLADALIAATCINGHYPLITFNTQDFSMIKGLKFAK